MHKESYLNRKKEVARWMRRLYEKGLTTSLGGNVSLKIDEQHIAITSSEVDKGRIRKKDIAIVTMDGKPIESSQKISVETGMHLAIYKVRPDVSAIVHAHPIMGSLFAATEQSINTSLLAEAYNIVGLPAKAPYAPPGSEQLAYNVAQAAKNSNVIIMANHGILAIGESLLKAFDRIEVLENAAKMTVLTKLLNDKVELSEEELEVIK